MPVSCHSRNGKLGSRTYLLSRFWSSRWTGRDPRYGVGKRMKEEVLTAACHTRLNTPPEPHPGSMVDVRFARQILILGKEGLRFQSVCFSGCSWICRAGKESMFGVRPANIRVASQEQLRTIQKKHAAGKYALSSVQSQSGLRVNDLLNSDLRKINFTTHSAFNLCHQ